MMKTYKGIDLFAGIGGIRLGFDKAFGDSIQTVFASEWDEKAQKTYKANFSKDNIEIAGDITQIDEKDIPSFDICMAGFPCLTGDSLILTDEGYKPIIDVTTKNYVLSHDGNFHRIEALMYQGKKEIFNIKTSGAVEINATGNHKFYVRKKHHKNGKKYFDEPKWVSVNEIINDNDGVYMFSSPRIKKEVLPKWDGVEISVNKTTKKIVNTLDVSDKTFWYLMGRFIGDGWIRKQYKKGENRNRYSGIIICCNKNETNDLITKINGKFNYTIAHEKTVDKFHFTNTELGVFASQFGEYSYGKILPNFVLNLPKELLKEFINGYIESDGHFIKNTDDGYAITSVNLKLLYGISHCIEKVYNVPCKIRKINDDCERLIENRLCHQQKCYTLNFLLTPDESRTKHLVDDDYIWYPISKIESNGIQDVYDIQVEGTHTFVVNHSITHNCQAFSVGGKRDGFNDNYHGTCRGTLFLDVVRICDYHKPKVIFCENVKGLATHDKKRTFQIIKKTFEDIGYKVFYKVLNSKDFGVPQRRDRIYIVCFRNDIAPESFVFPVGCGKPVAIKDILEDKIPINHFISNQYLSSLREREDRHKSKGNGFNYQPLDLNGPANTIVCGGSGHESNLIVDKRIPIDFDNCGKDVNKEYIRKMTPREWARLQGFDDSYKFPCSDTTTYKQLGNSVSVPVIEVIAEKIKEVLNNIDN